MPTIDLMEALELGLAWQANGGAAIIHIVAAAESVGVNRRARMVIGPHAQTGDLVGTIHAAAITAGHEALNAGRSRVYSIRPTEEGGEVLGLEGGDVDIFVEVLASTPCLVIVGAGHIAQPLAAIGSVMGMTVTVIDDRAEYANQERFPSADRVLAVDFLTGLRSISVTGTTFVVLVTRGHVHDTGCLRYALQTEASYIGMIGSQMRIRTVLNTLAGEGFSSEQLDRVFAPVGIDIGSRTPAEIAVAIAAEVINVSRSGKAPHLRLKRR